MAGDPNKAYGMEDMPGYSGKMSGRVPKHPHIRVNLQFYAKGLPDRCLGLTSESWNFNHASGRKMDLDELIVAIAMKLVLFYGNTVGFSCGEDTGSIEKKMARAGEAIAARYLKEVV